MNIFESIKDQITIEDVGTYHGIMFKNKKALCPFHREEDPSFSLHPSGLSAKCFGCDIAVDVIEFEYRLGSYGSRWEAAKALNDRYHLGLEFSGFDKEKAEEISDAHRLISWYC